MNIETIKAIAERAVNLAAQMGYEYDEVTIRMDVMWANEKCPLKLDELLAADDFNFAHDVFGINRHLNRTTGELEDCFLPRFAV